MKNFTLRAQIVILLLSAAHFAAAQNPAITDLYGRYIFSGECTLTDDATIPAENNYYVAILPGDGENEVKLLGMMGYSGASVLVYNQEEGTLKSKIPGSETKFPGSILCGTFYTSYMAVQLTAMDLTVSGSGNGIVLTSNADFNARISDPDAKVSYSMAGHPAGFTLTKETRNKTIEDITGTYDFVSDYLDFALVDDADLVFPFTIRSKEGTTDTVILKGFFGIKDATIEAEFYPEAGLIVLPMRTALPNNMYFGVRPGNTQGMFNYNAQPIFFVEDGQLTTPSFFILDNGADDVLTMPLMFTFLAGNAKKVSDSTGIRTSSAGSLTITAQPNALQIAVPEATDIRIYNAQGAVVASAYDNTVSANGLPAGIYLVKTAEHSTKVIVK